MKKEKFSGKINGVKYDSIEKFEEKLKELEKAGKPANEVSYRRYYEEDDVTENQLDLFDNCTEKERCQKEDCKHLIETFDIKMPNFPDLIKNEDKKIVLVQLIDKLLDIYKDLSDEDKFTKEEVDKYYKERIKTAKLYKDDVNKDKQKLFIEITNLKEKLKELTDKFNELGSISYLCDTYLNYYDYLKKLSNDSKKETSPYLDKEFQDAMKALEKMFSSIFD